MRVKPAAPGLVIRDPVSHQALPAEGGKVADSTFWRRRLAQGDVVPVEEPAPAPHRARPPTSHPAREE